MRQFSKKDEGLVKYIIFCSIPIFIILILILPSHQKIAQEQKKIEDLIAKSRKQKTFFQFYQDLIQRNKAQQSLLQDSDDLQVKIKGCHFNDAVAVIKSLIIKYGYREEKKKYAVLNSENETHEGSFLLQWTMTGSFSNLKPFLKQLNLLPCFESIEMIEVQYTGKNHAVSIRLWMKAAE